MTGPLRAPAGRAEPKRHCLIGDGGNDRLLGGKGSDRLTGGAGADTLVGDRAVNRYDAGSGNDIVKVANRRRELVSCGRAETGLGLTTATACALRAAHTLGARLRDELLGIEELHPAKELQVAARRLAAARAAAALAEAQRDDLIRRAHHEGGLSARDMAEPLGLSFQRVATVIAGDGDRPSRPTLHGAMRQILEENDGGWMAAHELAQLVYERGLYTRKDRSVIPPGQIRARAAKYPDLFEGTTDGSNRIRLRAT